MQRVINSKEVKQPMLETCLMCIILKSNTKTNVFFAQFEQRHMTYKHNIYTITFIMTVTILHSKKGMKY